MVQRRRRRRILFGLVQLLLCVAALEVGLRLLRPQNTALRMLLYLPPARGDYDSPETTPELLEATIIGYQPGGLRWPFVLNSRGFRTAEYATEKAPDTFRLVAIGDSFTFSCSDTPLARFWPNLVSRGLERQQSRPVELINLGMPATDPLFYRRIWELEGATLDADLVLIGFFVGNDFHIGLDRETADDSVSSLARSSLVYRLVDHVLAIMDADLAAVEPPAAAETAGGGQARAGYEAEGWAERYAKRPGGMSEAALGRIEAIRAGLCDRARTAEFEETFEETVEVARSLYEEVTESGARCLIVLLPDRFQVNSEDQQRILEVRQRSGDSYDWQLPQRLLTADFEEHGLAYLDLLPDFLERAPRVELYRDGDTHWSIAGSALAAERILAHLRERPELIAGRERP